MNNTSVDSYLRDGCGRCSLFATPACKVHRSPETLLALRSLLLEFDFVEAMKWGSPCYAVNGRNVVMLVSLKDACALSFFDGAALDDPDGALLSPGPNSRFGRYLKFASLDDLVTNQEVARALLRRAAEFARSGARFVPAREPDELPEELTEALFADRVLQSAFEALTPGRQRSHVIYVSGAKGAEARLRRVERCVPKILAGRGFNER